MSSATTSGRESEMSMWSGRWISIPRQISRVGKLPASSFMVKTVTSLSMRTNFRVISAAYVPNPPTIFGGYS